MNLQELLQKIENELKLRNYSRTTIKSYLICLSDYFRRVKIVSKNPDVQLIKTYLLAKQSAGLSSRTINIYLHSIKYFYKEVCKSQIVIDLKFAKTPNKLPVVLSRAEIEKIMSVTSNRKHSLLIAVSSCYPY